MADGTTAGMSGSDQGAASSSIAATGADLGSLQSQWDKLNQAAQSGGLQFAQIDPNTGKPLMSGKKIQLDVYDAQNAVAACNGLSGYIKGVYNQVAQNLRLELGPIIGIAPGTASDDPIFSTLAVVTTNKLVDQFNEAQGNLLKILETHQSNILPDIINALEYGCGYLQAADSGSAATINAGSSEQDVINSALQQNSYYEQQIAQSSGTNDDPWKDLSMGAPTSSISLPTGKASYQSWSSGSWGKVQATDSAALNDASKQTWASLASDSDNASLDGRLAQMTYGAASYTGQLTTQSYFAPPSWTMEWPDLHQLSKLNPQSVADLGRNWTSLAGILQDGFDQFRTNMGSVFATDSGTSGGTAGGGGWAGSFADTAKTALANYIATGPELTSTMSYLGSLASNTADWLETTRQYMPTLPDLPSTSAIPSATESVDTKGIHNEPGGMETIQASFVKPTTMPGKPPNIEVVYQGGIYGPKPAPAVDTYLTKYYRGQYDHWYSNSYRVTSSTMPNVSIPASATTGTTGADGKTGGDDGKTSGTGATDVVYMPGAGSTGAAGNTAGLADSGANVLDAADAANTPGSDAATAALASGSAPATADSGASTTPAAYTGSSAAGDGAGQAGDLMNAASQIAGAGGSGLQGANQLADGRQAAAAAVQPLSFGSEPEASAGGPTATQVAGEAGRLTSGDAAGTAESRLTTTATSRLFPRANSLAAEESLGRAGAAETEGTSGYPGGMGSPGSATGRGNDQKTHRTPGYLNSRRYLDEAMGDAPLTSISVVEDK